MLLHLRRQDWMLTGAIVLLAMMSLAAIRSANAALFWTQLIWFVVGFLAVVLFSLVDWRPLVNYRWVVFGFYALAVVLLIVTLIAAPTIRGTKGWLVLGSLRFQVSELAKITVLIVLAHFFARQHVWIANIHTIIRSFIYVALPALIVINEPDWGSALIFWALWVGFLLIAGLRVRHVIIGLVALAALSFVGWNLVLQDYQKERILGFWQPAYDPLGVNYNVIQSKIAIGSAGLLGKGFAQGTQVRLGFLPEASTDFIFAAFTEEWGILGALFLLMVFFFIIFRILLIGWRAPDNFSRFVCLGTVLVFLVEFFLNIGSNLGLVPVIGVTFPLFSYGGSSLLTKMMLIGIIQSIVRRSSF